ncbi:hypothetical protein PI124_g3990 [Phytophthora idaei]|nr:hypothetical protein PI125_g6413 [Phytophthora idaei]KAG3168868.1 hypothetical protein PI126_g3091 [Phytophthora idaei]KAG3251406.1 hypothetical protein PI124_g3990 [Phytophthora idaei]
MGGTGALIRYSSQRKGKVQALQMMYYLEGGLLMVSNLLQTDSWVNDELRTHCSACFVQFLPFRRRHHCRTCGEVVCGGCSSQRAIRLTDMNVECETRVCTFCIIRAADASIKANEAAMRETNQEHRRLSAVSVLSLASPAVRRRKQMTLLSADSELTLGSVVQLWPQPVPANETARLEVARHSTIRSAEVDPTMNLLVSIVARTLECPAAYIGIMDDSLLWVKASVGLDDRVTHIPRDDCVCAHTLLQGKTMIVSDTCTDKHFHAGGHAVGSNPMRYYAGTPVRVRGHEIGVVCAIDTEPHSRTTDAMKSTLEAVAKIVSEVLEQRVAAEGTMDSPVNGAILQQRHRTDTEELDLHASLLGLNLLPSSQRTYCSSEDHGYDAPRPSSYLPHEYSDKITMTMDYFQQLQRSAWAEHTIEPEMSNNGAIKAFDLFSLEKWLTRSVTKMTGDCSSVVTQLLNYEDALLYQQLFSHVSSRHELSGQTWVDSVTLHPSFGATKDESLQVVTHRREYPDGSNVIVAIRASKDEETSESDLLFGWFVAPSGREDEMSSVNVSCIAAQSYGNQSHDLILSLNLLRRLNQKLAMTRFFHLPSEMPPPIKPSTLRVQLRSDNQKTHEGADSIGSSEDGQDEKQNRNERGETTANPSNIRGDQADDPLPESNRAALVALHESEQGSQLNQNEQLLLELLDKTISTQEILAERQHEMADLITTHGNQLERISSALSRVESILLDKEAKRATSKTFTHNPESFETLARTFSAIEQGKSSRVTGVQLLADGYRHLLAFPTSQELASALYLTASQLAPPYEGVELRFGAKTFVRFLKQLETEQNRDLDSKQTLEKLLAPYPDYGQATQALLDSGRVVVPANEEKGEPLTIQAVHEQMMAIATDEGAGGVARKQQLALKLLQQCRCPEERVFLVRMLAHQNLRIGVGEKSILSALAMASTLSKGEDSASALEKEWIDCVTLAYAQHPNYRVLAELVHASQHENDIARRIEWLRDEAGPATGVPVLTMSAYPVSSVAAVLDRVGKSTSRTATCEYKYDGARVQVHLSLSGSNSSVRSVGRIFSRNMEDVTERYSSLLDVLEKRLTARNATAQNSPHVTSLIVEGEVVALNRETNSFLPFQVLQTKTTTEFCLFLFDLLAVDDTNLLQEPLRKRRTLLHNLVDEEPGYVEFVKHVDINLASNEGECNEQAAVVRECLEQAVSSGCEGLMIKALDDEESEYKAGRRSYSWMKLKHDYISTPSTCSKKRSALASASGNGTFLADTLDLVPIGAFYGKGRRAGVFGSFLMATYNSASGKFETIGKVGTGFSDAQLSEMAVRLQNQVLPETDEVPEQYRSIAIRSRHPDVWLSPEEVWEIKATQLTESPSYSCGAAMACKTSDDSAATARKGLALRFPRFVRYRPDKKPLQATESEQALELFDQQQQIPH